MKQEWQRGILEMQWVEKGTEPRTEHAVKFFLYRGHEWLKTKQQCSHE